MANLNAALQHIKRTRMQQSRVSPRSFSRYRAEYEAILRETEALGGDSAFGDLLEWVTTETEATHRLPDPTEVRTRARRICSDHGATIPPDSPLRS